MLITGPRLSPEIWFDAEGDEGEVNHPGCEMVKVGAEVRSAPVRVLVIAVSEFMAGSPIKTRHVHPIVVDEAEVPIYHEDIPMLEVSMGDRGPPELGNKIEESIR